MITVLLIIAFLLLLILIQLVSIAADIRKLVRKSLTTQHETGQETGHRSEHESSPASVRRSLVGNVQLGALSVRGHGGPVHPHHPSLNAGFFVRWYWRSGQWVAGAVPPGQSPGLPPAHPGAFENDEDRTWQSPGN